jgi:hypothetical protein
MIPDIEFYFTKIMKQITSQKTHQQTEIFTTNHFQLRQNLKEVNFLTAIALEHKMLPWIQTCYIQVFMKKSTCMTAQEQNNVRPK